MNMLRISIAALALLGTSPALAEAPVWVPILVEHDRVEQTLQIVRQLQLALEDRGITLLDPKDAAKRFEAVESMPAVTVPEPKVQATRQAVIDAAAEASKQNWAASEKKAEAFLALGTLQRDFVTWRAGLSERLFAGMCVTRVDGLLKEGRDDRAVLKAEECLGAYPGMSPDHHPSAEVLEAFKRARGKRTTNGDAELVVTMGEPTDGCTATLNGRPVGELPLRVRALLPGFPVRVQVRCGHLGRVHVVHLEPGENVLVVSPNFDQAVVTDHRYLGLRAPASATRRDYVARIGQALGAEAALVIGEADDSSVTVTRVALPGAHSTAELPMTGQGVDVGPLVPASPGAPSTRPSARTSEGTAEGKGGVPLLASAAVAAAGAVSYALSWSYYDLRSGYRTKIAEGSEAAAVLLYDDAGQQGVVTGLLGAGLLSTATPMVLPEYDEAPALAWIGGGLGVAGVVFGGVLAAQGQSCRSGSCDSETLDSALGPLVMLHSVPLLAVPLTYVVRALLGSDEVDSGVQASADGLSVRLRGEL